MPITTSSLEYHVAPYNRASFFYDHTLELFIAGHLTINLKASQSKSHFYLVLKTA